jgi:hypothetical protein
VPRQYPFGEDAVLYGLEVLGSSLFRLEPMLKAHLMVELKGHKFGLGEYLKVMVGSQAVLCIGDPLSGMRNNGLIPSKGRTSIQCGLPFCNDEVRV